MCQEQHFGCAAGGAEGAWIGAVTGTLDAEEGAEDDAAATGVEGAAAGARLVRCLEIRCQYSVIPGAGRTGADGGGWSSGVATTGATGAMAAFTTLTNWSR